MEKVYLAGGCFWGVEFYLQKLKGVLDTSVGFMGGDESHKTYEEVSQGATGHAEVVEVSYDEAKVSFRELILYFFSLHDPTTLNRQHNDIGTQYRSAIFFMNDSEEQQALSIIALLDEKDIFPSKIVTQVEKATEFFKATEEHQNFLLKRPHGYNCHTLRPDIKL